MVKLNINELADIMHFRCSMCKRLIPDPLKAVEIVKKENGLVVGRRTVCEDCCDVINQEGAKKNG